jgi:hypothetical protein
VRVAAHNRLAVAALPDRETGERVGVACNGFQRFDDRCHPAQCRVRAANPLLACQRRIQGDGLGADSLVDPFRSNVTH